MKGKALRKHSLHETAASGLLKLFISSNEWKKNNCIIHVISVTLRSLNIQNII